MAEGLEQLHEILARAFRAEALPSPSAKAGCANKPKEILVL
jgi:hypothetical protein